MPVSTTRYGVGGFIAAAPHGNVLDVTTINDDGTVTVVDGGGATISTGPATAQTLALVVADTQRKNADSLRAQLAAQIAAGSPARTAVATNSAYIAIGTPTNAQVAAEVKALAQQNNVIIPTLLRTIRVALGALDDDK